MSKYFLPFFLLYNIFFISHAVNFIDVTYRGGLTYGSTTVTNNQINSAPRIVCPFNYVVQGQNCVPSKKYCKDLMLINFYETCTKICWAGQAQGMNIPENENCPFNYTSQSYGPNSNNYNNNTYSTTTNTNYSNQNIVSYNSNSSVGTHIVTSNADKITSNSARCAALATINNNSRTTGYFEYGIDQRFSSVTNFADLGTRSVSFSNIISNLKPNTTYYCRAVMTNIENTFKGNIVSFRTENENKIYVSDIKYNTKKINTNTNTDSNTKNKSTTKTANNVSSEESDILCKDKNGNTDKLKIGEKFLSLEIENITNYVNAGSVSNYKVNYKNISSIDLSGLVFKIKLPEGFSFISSNAGHLEGDEIILEKEIIKSKESGEINFNLRADKGLLIGKTLIVSVNVSYDILDENDKVISDDISTYMISTVTNPSANNLELGNATFWSGWLFKALLTLILFVILYILGKNIYKKILHKRHTKNILAHE